MSKTSRKGSRSSARRHSGSEARITAAGVPIPEIDVPDAASVPAAVGSRAPPVEPGRPARPKAAKRGPGAFPTSADLEVALKAATAPHIATAPAKAVAAGDVGQAAPETASRGAEPLPDLPTIAEPASDAASVTDPQASRPSAPALDIARYPAWDSAMGSMAAFQRSAFELMKAGNEASTSFWTALLGRPPGR